MFRTFPPVGVPFSWKFVFAPGKPTGDAFDESLRKLVDGEVFLTGSGRSALYLILAAASRTNPSKKEVIVPDYTCWSVPSAIVRAGLKIRPVDIETENHGLAPEKLRKSINENTLAVVITHLFGIPGRVDSVEEICSESGILLIDDAAQAMDASLNGRPIGSFGKVGLFSFGRGKNITTRYGGAAAVRDESLIEVINEIYDNSFEVFSGNEIMGMINLAAYKILFSPYMYWIPDNLPFLKLGVTEFNPDFNLERMPAGDCSRGSMMMNWREDITRHRTEVASEYTDRLRTTDIIRLPVPPEGSIPSFLRFPVYIENTDIRRYILKRGHRLGISGMYPGTVRSIDGIEPYLADRLLPCPAAERVAETLITLPTHYCIRSRDIRRILNFIDKSCGYF